MTINPARSIGTDLEDRRAAVVRAWEKWCGDRAAGKGARHVNELRNPVPLSADGTHRFVRREIVESWWRSFDRVPHDLSEAPMSSDEIVQRFESSLLGEAIRQLEPELQRTAHDADLIVALTDPDTHVLWTYGSRMVRRKAESVNFTAGARWDEASVGTNAPALACQTVRFQTVFSAEHYAPFVHGWVCWAAPIKDPETGELLGVLDLSTTWDRAHPMGGAMSRTLAALIAREVQVLKDGFGGRQVAGVDASGGSVTELHPRLRVAPSVSPSKPSLELNLLGGSDIRLGGRPLTLTKRQQEILAIIALHPDGLNSQKLHACLYGDEPVSLSTLKSEVSHLRTALNGELTSRPYAIGIPVEFDVDRTVAALRRGDVFEAVASYGGDLLPGTNSPFLIEHSDVIRVAVREALLADPDPDAALRYTDIAPHDIAVAERALQALGSRSHVAKPLLMARIAAYRG